MGWSAADVDLFIELHTVGGRVPMPVRMCEMGAECLYTSPDHIRDMAKVFSPTVTLDDDAFAVHRGQMPVADLAQRLGWSYSCIDLSGEYNAIPIDLNFDDVPNRWRGAFNVVTNFGTTEHVIGQMNAHKIMHDLCEPGGLIVHNVPAGGYFTHGFFSYTPNFFLMLERANAYETLSLRWLVVPEDRKTVDGTFGVYAPMPKATAEKFGYVDAALQVVFRRTSANPFVPPFDGLVGELADKKFAARYSANPRAFRRNAENAPNVTSLQHTKAR